MDNIYNSKGASKLAHSKGFASDKKYAALVETPALPANRRLRLSIATFLTLKTMPPWNAAYPDVRTDS